MALIAHWVTYETDGDEEVVIKLNYEEDTADNRISDGGFTKIATGCKFPVPRKQLKPRFIDRIKNDKIERVYVKEHSKWVTMSKEKTTVKACGECLTCSLLQLLYN